MKNNKKIFCLVNAFIITLFACSLIEAFTYSGFLVKHFDVKIGIAFLFIFVVAFIILRKLFEKPLFEKLLIISTYLLTSVYLIFDTMERVAYLNFVFSHFHLHPYLLLLSTIVMSFLFILNTSRRIINRYVFTILTVVLIQYVTTDIVGIFKSNMGFMLKNPMANYDQKMEITVEKLPYDFAMFIKANTPESANILVPPQGYPWSQTSNTAYYRYFLYPRTLLNGNEKEAGVDLNTVDYVLIAYGETTISEYGFTNVWPKFDVKGEYVVYWSPETGEMTKDEKGIYKYNYNDKSEKWGLIKIKH